MKLTPRQRDRLRAMFGGCCAYCGHELGKKWHADHVEAVRREWWKKGGGLERPENDTISNLFPACVACNIHKHCMSLETWREYLQDQVEMARRNSAPFRHAERFGKIVTITTPIVFYFETYQGAA